MEDYARRTKNHSPETITETTIMPSRISPMLTLICAVALHVFIYKSWQIEFDMQKRSDLSETDRKIRYRNAIFLNMAMITGVGALFFASRALDQKNNAG